MKEAFKKLSPVFIMMGFFLLIHLIFELL